MSSHEWTVYYLASACIEKPCAVENWCDLFVLTDLLEVAYLQLLEVELLYRTDNLDIYL